MKLPLPIEQLVSESRAKVRVGYPWWLRPWLARNVIAITLGRRVYLSPNIARRSEEYLVRLMRHELAHVAQMNREGVPRFLWRYVREFLGHYRRVRSFHAAYRLISYEVEAAAAEEDL
jgi:hypothetical protein